MQVSIFNFRIILLATMMLPGVTDIAFSQDKGAAEPQPGSAVPRPPGSIEAHDTRWDNGKSISVTFALSPDDVKPDKIKPDKIKPAAVAYYLVERSGELHGVYEIVGNVVPDKHDYKNGKATFAVQKCGRDEPYFFRVRAVGPEGQKSGHVETREPAFAERQWFDGGRFWLGVITLLVCGSVVLFIEIAKSGRELKIRKIAGLEAIDEAVGRATEMGRPVLFIPGIQDINDIQTLAGLTMLARVAQVAAEYDAKVEVPTCRSLVMTTARETVQSAFLAAGRPDAYNEDAIYYVTDEQFGYVAYLSGMMVREKPAACFYMGSFFAESLILAETGNSIGAIQVAGTAQPAQLPFFVAACDYTLIGEEFFAATAILSGDPHQLGSLKGQDVGKLIVAGLLIVGCGLVTLAGVIESDTIQLAVEYLRDVMLKPGS
jgi:hypothetical protein